MKKKKNYTTFENTNYYNRQQRRNFIATVSKNNNKIQWQDMKTKTRFKANVVCFISHFEFRIHSCFMRIHRQFIYSLTAAKLSFDCVIILVVPFLCSIPKPKPSLLYNFKLYIQLNNKSQITFNRFAKEENTIECLNIIDIQIINDTRRNSVWNSLHASQDT